MKIAILGAGNIGGTVGKAWAAAGHTVVFGVRNPGDAKFDDVRLAGEVTTVEQALVDAQVVLLAVPGAAAMELIDAYAGELAGKIVVDATNNLRGAEMNSLGKLAQAAPAALGFRAFSTLGWENFAEPTIGGDQVDLFYCGAAEGKTTMAELIADVGLRPVYVGGVEQAPLLDNLTRLWFAMAFTQGYGRRVAFKLLAEQG